jgi:hypothetical protein
MTSLTIRTHHGRKFRMLNIIDEFKHECLAISTIARSKSIDPSMSYPTSFCCEHSRSRPI